MRITVGDTVYQDGDLPLGDLMARYDEGVTTSAPAPGDFLRVFERLPGEVLVLTVSQRLSSTTASARLAADTAGSRVRVIDSGTSAGSLALIALHACSEGAGGGHHGRSGRGGPLRRSAGPGWWRRWALSTTWSRAGACRVRWGAWVPGSACARSSR